MNNIKRITVICFAVIVLAANLPLCASATDPVSAATMANALAQAITAYGASQGVSMTFDVASTDGIGEGVHELWDDFKEDIQDNNVPTYDSLAVTMWADIYTKIGNNVGININDTEMPYIDAFWNWLLSGPAEMTKVDNEYYQLSQSQYGPNATPLVVYSSPYNFGPIPLVSPSNSAQVVWESSKPLMYGTTGFPTWYNSFLYSQTGDVYCFYVTSESRVYFCSTTSGNVIRLSRKYYYEDQFNYQTQTQNYNLSSVDSGFYTAYWNLTTYDELYIPSFTQKTDGLDYISGFLNGTIDADNNQLGIVGYIGEANPNGKIYIPDNEDVNYSPLPYVGGLDIPWDDSLFGDGSGTLTDAQSEAITGVVDDAITDSLEKTLTLVDTENPDIPAPNEVYIPLLPVELPSFNFSLSGIWHYVVSWVQSLGAWLSLMFQTWAVLPSAITIPVYATAVIVIVLGVYKRFFM